MSGESSDMTTTIILLILIGLIIVAIGLVAKIGWELVSEARAKRKLVSKELDDERSERAKQLSALRDEIAKLEPLKKYQGIPDAQTHVSTLLEQASTALKAAKQKATTWIDEANLNAGNTTRQAQADAAVIIDQAKVEAKAIAGSALADKEKAGEYARMVQALKNIIEGYGDQYMIPVYSLLDDLAEAFGHTEAGEKLKSARAETKRLMKIGLAANCDYVEMNRKTTAIHFVIDAFNGKVDSILSRSKADNFGTLRQQIIDSFNVVNVNGAAFRNARITDAYLESRLEELRWGCIAHELREKEREEQRVIREQIREEERAQREFDKAIRDAAKEEDMLRKAMEKARQHLEFANEEQKQRYEAQLAELSEKLKMAEEKNQRALSMAQQTRRGHVYVISNIGSFGEDVFKVGMTRRLDPKERVQELGDASVPFSFDIHAMIYSEDAPTLERNMHKVLLRQQVNKVNPRKEFFRAEIKAIREEFERLGIFVHWTMMAEAREYRESQLIEHKIIEDTTAAAEWEREQEQVEVIEYEEQS